MDQFEFLKVQLSRLEDDAALGKNGGLWIAFHTPTCVMPDWVFAQYPNNMAIILDKWFKDLHIGDNAMAVTLRFKGVEARLGIPYDRIFQMYDVATGGPYQRRGARLAVDPPVPEERGVVVSLADFRSKRDAN